MTDRMGFHQVSSGWKIGESVVTVFIRQCTEFQVCDIN